MRSDPLKFLYESDQFIFSNINNKKKKMFWIRVYFECKILCQSNRVHLLGVKRCYRDSKKTIFLGSFKWARKFFFKNELFCQSFVSLALFRYDILHLRFFLLPVYFFFSERNKRENSEPLVFLFFLVVHIMIKYEEKTWISKLWHQGNKFFAELLEEILDRV